MYIKNNYKLPGINDEHFIRGSVPMTKCDVRTLTIAKANINPSGVFWDIGAGTGSISIEAALLATDGSVYAIERNSEAISLIKQNINKFNVNNLHVIEGEAPNSLIDLPQPDSVVIGGSGGNLNSIIDFVWQKLKNKGTLVINAVTLDTTYQAIQYLETLTHNKVDSSLVSVTKIKKVGSYHMMESQNPVFIISVEKDD